MFRPLERMFSELLTPLELGDTGPQSWTNFGKFGKSPKNSTDIRRKILKNGLKIGKMIFFFILSDWTELKSVLEFSMFLTIFSKSVFFCR